MYYADGHNPWTSDSDGPLVHMDKFKVSEG